MTRPGSLIQINQGSQTRTFGYSSLGRLLSGTNPEDGTITYAYDNNGNLTLKTDPRTFAKLFDPYRNQYYL